MRASTLRSKRWPGYDSRFYAHIISRALAEPLSRALRNGTGTMLLKILDFKGLELTAEQRRMVETCEDTAQLDRWAERALDVKTAAELFA